jgi:hypothetical protein
MTYPDEFENKSDDEKAMIRIGAHIVESWTSLTAVKAKDGTLDDFLVAGRWGVWSCRFSVTGSGSWSSRTAAISILTTPPGDERLFGVALWVAHGLPRGRRLGAGHGPRTSVPGSALPPPALLAEGHSARASGHRTGRSAACELP